MSDFLKDPDEQFFSGLETPDQKSEEWADSATALLRLKRAPMSHEVVEKEKQAGLAEYGKLLKHPGALALGGLGALGLGAEMYSSSKARPELQGRSRDEDALRNKVRGIQDQDESQAGLGHKIGNRSTEFMHGLAQAFRQHPVKATLGSAAAGFAAGTALAKALGAGT